MSDKGLIGDFSSRANEAEKEEDDDEAEDAVAVAALNVFTTGGEVRSIGESDSGSV